MPDWLAARKKTDRKRRNTGEQGQGIRLIQVSFSSSSQLPLPTLSLPRGGGQDFDFPEASNKIKTTRDGQFCLATGTYKPRLKIFDLLELGLKSERVTDAENVDFCILSDDWTKTLHLQTDRSLSVHTASSALYSTRIPTHGRALAYHFPTCDALVGAAGSQVFRLNLDQGRFLNPLDCSSSVLGVNALDLNSAHGLLACGTECQDSPGTVEFWDLRARRRVGILNLPLSQLQGATSFSGNSVSAPLSVSALSSRTDGLNLAVGTSTGHTLLYDLRSNAPYTFKDQGYGLPIKKIEWCYSSGSTESIEAAGLVASVDAKVLKIWGAQTATNLISINPPNNINDLHIYPDSGLVLLANEASPLTAYYVPQLGQAPKWCRFLDSMTEELEHDSADTLYDDFKFVDRAELRQLGMEHLVGSTSLRPYMHGFFVDLRLYTKARAIANPFAYAEYRDRLVREKMDKERESRIRTSTRTLAQSKKDTEARLAVETAQVNKQLAEKIRLREEKDDKARARKLARKGLAPPEDDDDDDSAAAATTNATVNTANPDDGPSSILTDTRFGALFKDPDFQVDQDSLEFAMLNPSTVSRNNLRPKDKQTIGAEEEEEDEDEDKHGEKRKDGDDGPDDNTSDENSSDEGGVSSHLARKNNECWTEPSQISVNSIRGRVTVAVLRARWIRGQESARPLPSCGSGLPSEPCGKHRRRSHIACRPAPMRYGLALNWSWSTAKADLLLLLP